MIEKNELQFELEAIAQITRKALTNKVQFVMLAWTEGDGPSAVVSTVPGDIVCVVLDAYSESLKQAEAVGPVEVVDGDDSTTH